MALDLFDVSYYRFANQDLAAAGLTTDQQLTSHFQQYGLNEGRDFSPVVNLSYYRSSNADLANFDNTQLLSHLQNYGVAEGRRFSRTVDLQFYLSTYEDLRNAFAPTPENDRVEALQHLISYGLNENRKFSRIFERDYYKGRQTDLAAIGVENPQQLLGHFERTGISQRRQAIRSFDVNLYYTNNRDLQQAGFTSEQLYDHFQNHGLYEGRASSSEFNVRYYLATNPDLKAAGFNFQQAYDHFVIYGQNEGRTGVPQLVLDKVTQLDTGSDELSNGAIADRNGNVYMTGFTTGTIGGSTHAGEKDAWVAKYNSNGDLVWAKQFGSAGEDESVGIAVDASNNIYLTGFARGNLAGNSLGGTDVWVAKYDADGNLLWNQQFGTNADDTGVGAAIDGNGNVYITGNTYGTLAGNRAGDYDAWVAKIDASNGNRVWIKQFGSDVQDTSKGIAVDQSGGIYVTGHTQGTLPGQTNAGFSDAWLVKYNSDGDLVWSKQFGSDRNDRSNAITADGNGDIYLTGYTSGNLAGENAGEGDAWVAKYSGDGNRNWIKQLGTANYDESYGVTVDPLGKTYIAGRSNSVGEDSGTSQDDAWVAEFDIFGNFIRKTEQSTPKGEGFRSITNDVNGVIYASGYATNSNRDAWLVRYR